VKNKGGKIEKNEVVSLEA